MRVDSLVADEFACIPRDVFDKVVAGFAASELDVVIEGSVLIVSGKAEERDEGEYLFRGIAGRQFRRQFALADGMEVIRASLERGLLSIDLAQHPQEVRKIKISVSQ